MLHEGPPFSGTQPCDDWLAVQPPRQGEAPAESKESEVAKELEGAGESAGARKSEGSPGSEGSPESKESEVAKESESAAMDAGSIVACRAALSAAALTVDEMVALALATDGEALPEFPGIKRGDNPTMNLSWLLVGSDRVTGKYLDHQIFNFEAGGSLKLEAVEVAVALRSAPSINLSHRLVLNILTEFADLVAADPGKLPLGPILGYGAMTGVPMVQHTYADAFGREVAFVLPRDKADGESVLPDIVKAGPLALQLTAAISEHLWQCDVGPGR